MSSKAFSGGVVLAAASAAGFFSSLLYSIGLSQEQYGKIVTYLSASSILIVAAPFGFTSYLLTNPELYKSHKNSILLFTILSAIVMSSVSLLFYPLALALTFILLTSTGALASVGLLKSQINSAPLAAAIYQSNQAIVKLLSATIIVLLPLIGYSVKVDDIAISLSLIAGCLISLPLMLKSLLLDKRHATSSNLLFLRELKKSQLHELRSFWLSAVLGVSYSLGVIPLTAATQGVEMAAYLGVYFIFWSGSNILITAAINNHYWPKACMEAKKEVVSRKLLVESGYVTLFISLSCAAGTLVISALFAPLLWPHFSAIQDFLYLSSIALFLRPLSAWIGMIFLSVDSRVIRKAKVQIGVTIIMAIYLLSVDFSSPQTLALMLVKLEACYFAGYVVLAKIPYFKSSAL